MSDELTSKRLGSTFNSLSVRLVHSYHIDAMLMLLEEELPAATGDVLRAELGSVRDVMVRHFGTACLPETLDELVKFFVEESLKNGSFGFLLKAEQPYFVLASTGRLTYSWDTVRSRWFYGQTYQEALLRVHQWASRNKEEAAARR